MPALSLLSKVVSASRFISHQVYSPHTCLLAHKMDVTILSKREGLLSLLTVGRGDSGSSACVACSTCSGLEQCPVQLSAWRYDPSFPGDIEHQDTESDSCFSSTARERLQNAYDAEPRCTRVTKQHEVRGCDSVDLGHNS